MTIARLGEGKWHVVRVMSVKSTTIFTACRIELKPFMSSLRKVETEVKDGEPTCKHCIRLRVGEVI